MFKLVTLYRRVDDEAKLEEFFANTHLQLAEQLPGLLKSELSRVSGTPDGNSRFHITYELYFDDVKAFEDSVTGEVGRELIAALRPWREAGIITWYYSEAWEETFLLSDKSQ